MRSIAEQTVTCQHILVDGASTDGTLDVIEAQRGPNTLVISGPDQGMYDAINKGLKLATGEIVGVLNADDYYPTNDVLQLVEDAFDNYLYEYYAECATANTKINDKRSSFIHNCNKWLVSNLPFLFLVFLIFSFCGVDKNLKEKEYAVKILNPIELESINSPIETRSTIENGEFNVDLSDSVKELLNDRRTEEEKQQSAPAPAASR